MSPSPPNTVITLYVDSTLKGRAHVPSGNGITLGAWVAVVKREGSIRQHVLDATDLESAERETRGLLGIPRRTLVFTPTSEACRAWQAVTRL